MTLLQTSSNHHLLVLIVGLVEVRRFTALFNIFAWKFLPLFFSWKLRITLCDVNFSSFIIFKRHISRFFEATWSLINSLSRKLLVMGWSLLFCVTTSWFWNKFTMLQERGLFHPTLEKRSFNTVYRIWINLFEWVRPALFNLESCCVGYSLLSIQPRLLEASRLGRLLTVWCYRFWIDSDCIKMHLVFKIIIPYIKLRLFNIIFLVFGK